MMKRLLFTFKLLAILLVVDACLKCKADPLPYYDFEEIILYSENGVNEVLNGETFLFTSRMGDVYYLASNDFSLNLTSNAIAREECPTDGWEGFKYGIDSISITSSSDWDSTHRAGTNLDELVYFKRVWNNGEEYGLLSEARNFYIIKENGSSFEIRTSPTENLKHVFHLIYYKSSGETVEGATDTITWVP